MSKEVFTLEAVLSLNDQAFQKGLDSAKSKSSGFKDHLLANLASGAITKAFDTIVGSFQKIANVINSHVAPAVSRLDTLNSYSKTMTALGFSTDQATEAQSKLSSAIDGLPTTLDGIISWQQQFTALSDDIEGATDLTIALNNATLAAGKGQEAANSAMSNWYGIISAGAPDAQHWQSLYSTMPAQMNQLAQSILGVNAKSDDLYAAWKKGTVTTEDVTNALIKLNAEGLNGVASFEDQAQIGAQTISTAYGNIGTAISRNIANVMNVLNGDATAGGGRIVELLLNVKNLINQVGSTISTFVKAHQPEIDAIMQALNAIFKGEDVAGNVETVLNNVGSIITDFFNNVTNFLDKNQGVISQTIASVLGAAVKTIITLLPIVIDSVFRLIMAMVEWLQDSNNVTTLVNGIVQMVTKLVESFAMLLPILLPAIVTIIKNVALALTTPENTNMLIEAVITLIGALAVAIWESLPVILELVIGLLTNIGETLVGWFAPAIELIGGFFKSVWDAVTTKLSEIWQAIKNFFAPLIEFVRPILEAFQYLFSTIFEAVRVVVGRALDSVKNTFSKIWNGIVNFVSPILNSIKTTVSNAFTALVNLVSGPLENVKNTVSKAFDTIRSTISNIVDKAKTWGKDLLDNFINGIKSKITALGNAVKGVADKIKNIIGFSEPEEGPLSNFHTYAPDMIELFTQGLYANERKLQNALSDVFQMPTLDSVSVSGAGSNTSAERGLSLAPVINIYATEGQDVRELARAVSRELQAMIDDKEKAYA